ncbi:MAG TPA: iron dependent repressor, metal binding and dimerization domain protein [Thermohalobaculum sp.]|nr:iron dependent repressor, metal binding and dimerization domain protein [Thermohalobaculum sp.]
MIDRDETAPPHLREAKRQARSFERVRQAHQREVAEDYVELIADLIDVTGEARAVDLAERLGVTNATVNNTLNRLTRERHCLVRDFLMQLGDDAETAKIDAEGIEHHTSEKTLAALKRFLGR